MLPDSTRVTVVSPVMAKLADSVRTTGHRHDRQGDPERRTFAAAERSSRTNALWRSDGAACDTAG